MRNETLENVLFSHVDFMPLSGKIVFVTIKLIFHIFHFRGGLVKHFALAHDSSFKFLAEVSKEKGQEVYEPFRKLVWQGVLRYNFATQTVVKCELCDQEFVKEHLKTHQILKHYLLNYTDEVSQFHTQRGSGDCPMFDCQVGIIDMNILNFLCKTFH